jgi:hypothetical protein
MVVKWGWVKGNERKKRSRKTKGEKGRRKLGKKYRRQMWVKEEKK